MLNKAIQSGKERRKAHQGAKAYCRACFNHGYCKHCRRDRLYARQKAEQASRAAMQEYNRADQ